MKIDDLIAMLNHVRDVKGNIEVQGSSPCGTNQGFVLFDIKPEEKKDFDVDDCINDHGTLCLCMEISNSTRQQIKDSTAEMNRLGYTFYCSQYVIHGEMPSPGLSPCDWHNPW